MSSNDATVPAVPAFVVTDVVRLRGITGPAMLVLRVFTTTGLDEPIHNPFEYECIWFTRDDEFRWGRFLEAHLERDDVRLRDDGGGTSDG